VSIIRYAEIFVHSSVKKDNVLNKQFILCRILSDNISGGIIKYI